MSAFDFDVIGETRPVPRQNPPQPAPAKPATQERKPEPRDETLCIQITHVKFHSDLGVQRSPS